VSTRSVQATPGGTFVLSTVANTFEGPVRIHERTTFVVGADGTIRVDGSQFDFVGCPAA
jgi:peroxiredoxin